MRRQTRLIDIRPQRLPDLFGDERHERMQQPQQAVEASHQHPARRGLPLAVLLEWLLSQLDIPVTELVPDEAVGAERGDVEFVTIDCGANLTDRAIQRRQDPSL